MLGEPLKHIFPDEYENDRGETIHGKEMRWSSFKDKRAEDMYRIMIVSHFLSSKPWAMSLRILARWRTLRFGFPAGEPSLLEKAVTGVDELLRDFDEHIDDLGDMYEYMLSKLSAAGTNGQFRTPEHIRKMMVELIDPKPGELFAILLAVPLVFLFRRRNILGLITKVP